MAGSAEGGEHSPACVYHVPPATCREPHTTCRESGLCSDAVRLVCAASQLAALYPVFCMPARGTGQQVSRGRGSHERGETPVGRRGSGRCITVAAYACATPCRCHASKGDRLIDHMGTLCTNDPPAAMTVRGQNCCSIGLRHTVQRPCHQGSAINCAHRSHPPAAMPLMVIMRQSSMADWKGCCAPSPFLRGSRDSRSMISGSSGLYSGEQEAGA